MVLVLVTGLLGGLMTASTVSADPTPGCVVEIPRIDLGDVFDTETEDEWDTKIQVQNVGGVDGGAIAFFWPPWDGTCPSNDPGPMGHACMQLPFNGVWTLHSQIPDGAQSAIIYAVDDLLFQQCCVDAGEAEGDTEDWKEWKLKCACTGPDLAVTVDRWGSDPYDEFMISSSYTGVTDPDMVGVGYDYFAPYVMHNYHDLDTTITIQNSGQWCTSCWIYYKQQGNCEQMTAQHIEAIAPGQSIKIGPGADAEMEFPTPEVGSDWLGSAYISCNEDMAIIIDQLSHPDSTNLGTLLSMRGMPYVPNQPAEEINRKQWFADLLFREISGWDSSIQVQNMTQSSMPTFVTVEFFDQSGDHILYLGDWVCRNGTATFYLPAIIDLGVNYPFGYLGAAEIQSHRQVDYPGGAHDGEDIVVVVDLKKRKLWRESINDWDHTMPGETQGGAYNAHPWDQKENMWGWAMPYIAKKGQGVTSQIVIRNNSNCTKIRGTIYVKDETGTQVAYIPVGWMMPKHMARFDLNYLGMISPGFVGAAEFFVEGVEQLCDLDGDGHTDIEPVMPSVVVLNYGWDKELPSGGAGPIVGSEDGDLARVYEAIPFYFRYSDCWMEISGQVIDDATLEPIKDVSVRVDDVEMYKTDSTGHYQFWVAATADPDESFTVTAYKEGYTTSDPGSWLVWPMCYDYKLNFELGRTCTVAITGTVEDKETGLPIQGITVNAASEAGPGTTDLTDADGNYEILDVPFDPDSPVIVTVTDSGLGASLGYNPATDTVYLPECGTSAAISFQLHQTPKSRILLYYGNGGEPPDLTPHPETLDYTEWFTPHQYFAAKALFTYFGYHVDYTNSWPTDPDLEEYKVIFLLGPGNESVPPDPESDMFTPGQVSQLDLFLRNGGRLVVMSDISGTQATAPISVENRLLGQLNDLDVWFCDLDGSGDTNPIPGALADGLPPEPPVGVPEQLLGGAVHDVHTLDFNTAISVCTGVNAVPGLIAELTAPHPWATVDIASADTMPGVNRLHKAGYAGDVLVIGDKDWMDDPSFMGQITIDPSTGQPNFVWANWPADNGNFLLNIFTF
jgi:hypothetical protein